MIRSFFQLLAIALLLSSCGPGNAGSDAPSSPAATPAPTSGETTAARPSPTESSRAVERALTAYYEALSARDWQRFADSFHDGAHIAFVIPDSTGAVEGVTFQSIPDFVALAPLGPDSREIFEERMTDHAIHVSGDLAAAWVQYEARFGDPGDVMEWTGTDAITLIRLRDRWRITSLTYVPEFEKAVE